MKTSGCPREWADRMYRAFLLPLETPEEPPGLVRFSLERIDRQAGRDHRVPPGKPCHGQEEEAPEEEGRAHLGNAERGGGAAVDGWNDFQVAFQPDAREAHQSERQERRRGPL